MDLALPERSGTYLQYGTSFTSAGKHGIALTPRKAVFRPGLMDEVVERVSPQSLPLFWFIRYAMRQPGAAYTYEYATCHDIWRAN